VITGNTCWEVCGVIHLVSCAVFGGKEVIVIIIENK